MLSPRAVSLGYLTSLVAVLCADAGICVICWAAVCDLVDMGRASELIYLNLCKAFDTLLHDMLVSKMERHGLDEWTTWWIQKWLHGHALKSCL